MLPTMLCVCRFAHGRHQRLPELSGKARIGPFAQVRPLAELNLQGNACAVGCSELRQSDGMANGTALRRAVHALSVHRIELISEAAAEA